MSSTFKAIDYSKKKVGKFISGSKLLHIWRFELDGNMHMMEFYESKNTNRKKVVLDNIQLIDQIFKTIIGLKMTFNYLNHEIVILFDSLSVDLMIDNISFKSAMAEPPYSTNVPPIQKPEEKHMNLTYTTNYKMFKNTEYPTNPYQNPPDTQNLLSSEAVNNYPSIQVHNFEDKKQSDFVLNEIDELSKQSSNLINKMLAEKSQSKNQNSTDTNQQHKNYDTPEKILEKSSNENQKEIIKNQANLMPFNINRERINSTEVSSKFGGNELFQKEDKQYNKSTFYPEMNSRIRKFSDSYPNFQPLDSNLLGSNVNASLKPKSKYIANFNWKKS